ncbi:hypothetical protein [Mesorhizobium sp. M1B.F.Ca.ET.045.04.1.1]|uniref:pentapeptide repeat-containing protein n=1 Tax=Mesorhizobium sp. M1B.F.Ca.ET.045.04.1.1 TaxID=2493673 RepID=UPI000F75CA1E|nr:hypothetical protein [Mesorhizobium sp. M1B.F.Ca.ET.045.04.1.1]AZO30454.1 hypothetical protein EJ071_25705 [Mesorhizobium sp. M1B.F.Ca.ET.045.04.1.1]
MPDAPSKPRRSTTRKVGTTQADTNRPGWYRRFGNAVNAIEHDPIVRIFGAIIVLLGVYVAFETLLQINVDLKDREQERIDKAIEKLQTRAAGNTGRGSALSFLYGKGWDLSNYDQSCEAVGVWDDEKHVCRNPPIVQDLRMQAPGPWMFKTDGNHTPISNFRLTNAEIENALIEREYFIGINLDGAEFVDGSIKASALTGSFQGTAFNGTDLSDTEFSGSVEGAYFKYATLNRATFLKPDGIKVFDGIAWSDFPPITYRQGKDGDDIVLEYPLPIELLQQVRFCSPPMINGSIQPIEDRPDIKTIDCKSVPAQTVFDNELKQFQSF